MIFPMRTSVLSHTIPILDRFNLIADNEWKYIVETKSADIGFSEVPLFDNLEPLELVGMLFIKRTMRPATFVWFPKTDDQRTLVAKQMYVP